MHVSFVNKNVTFEEINICRDQGCELPLPFSFVIKGLISYSSLRPKQIPEYESKGIFTFVDLRFIISFFYKLRIILFKGIRPLESIRQK